MVAVKRRNPAEPGYWLRRLGGRVDTLEVVTEDTRAEPGTVTPVPTNPVDSITLSNTRPPYVLVELANPPASRILTLSMSTQVRRSASNERVAQLPLLAATA